MARFHPAFVLTSGAIRANAWAFFVTLAGVRMLRFGVESALAARYGRRVLSIMESPTFTVIVGVMIALAVVGTLVSAVAVYRGSTRRGPCESSRRPARASPVTPGQNFSPA